MIIFSWLFFITTFFATMSLEIASMDTSAEDVSCFSQKRRMSHRYSSSQLPPYQLPLRVAEAEVLESRFRITGESLDISMIEIYDFFEQATLNIEEQACLFSEKLYSMAYDEDCADFQEICINYGNVAKINHEFFSLIIKKSCNFFNIKKVCISERLDLVITLISQESEHITPIVSISTAINQLPNVQCILAQLFSKDAAIFHHDFFTALCFEFEFKKDYSSESLRAICQSFIKPQLALLQFEGNLFGGKLHKKVAVGFNASFISIFFASLKNHPSLTAIDFTNTKLHTQIEEFASIVFPILKTCKQLQGIDLRNNYLSCLSEPKLENYLKLLVQLPHLTSIDLRDNGFKVERIERIESLLPGKITLIS